jgi:hypothetical protein
LVVSTLGSYEVVKNWASNFAFTNGSTCVALPHGKNGGVPIDDEFFRKNIAGRTNESIFPDIWPELVGWVGGWHCNPRVCQNMYVYRTGNGCQLGVLCFDQSTLNMLAPYELDAATHAKMAEEKEAEFRRWGWLPRFTYVLFAVCK